MKYLPVAITLFFGIALCRAVVRSFLYYSRNG
jgi:hypothetical protein